MQTQINLWYALVVATATFSLVFVPGSGFQAAEQMTSGEKLHLTLVYALTEGNEDEFIPVAIWLRAPTLNDLNPADAIVSGQWQTTFAEYRARHRDVAQPVVAYLHNLGYEATWSEVVPSVFATLPREIVFTLTEREDVLMIYLQPQNRQTFVDTHPVGRARSLTQAGEVTSEAGTAQAPTVWNRGYEGESAPLVAIVEGGKVDFNNPFLRDGGEASIVAPEVDHTTAVAGVVASNPEEAGFSSADPEWFYRGVAWRLGSGVYSAAYTSHGSASGDLDIVVTEALEAGARVLNNSWGDWEEDSCQQEPVLNWDSIYFDYISRHYRVTVVTAVGNFKASQFASKSWAIPNPAWAYNVISVGGIDDADDANWANDEMWYEENLTYCNTTDPVFCFESSSTDKCWGSVYDEGNYGREKPEVCAVATDIDSTRASEQSPPWTSRFPWPGTSFAAPAVAAEAALLMEREPMLQTEPETVKAIIMATARHDVYPGTEHDGLGSIDIALADEITRDGQFATLTGPEAEFPQEVDFFAVAGDWFRVVVTWASNPDNGYVNDPLVTDFDVHVYGPEGSNLTSVRGNVDDNNYLWLEFLVRETGAHHIQMLVRDWGEASAEPVGVAWARLRRLDQYIYLPLVLKGYQ